MGQGQHRAWVSAPALAAGAFMILGACSAGVGAGGAREAGTPAPDSSSGRDGEAGSISTSDSRPSDDSANGPRDSTAFDVVAQDQTAADAGVSPDVSGIDGLPSLERPGVFVGVGYGGRRIRSTDDGVTWTDDVSIVPNGGDDNNLLRAVTWGNGQFVALGYRVMTSPNGKDWNDRGAVLGQWIGAAVYAQTQYVSVGGYGLRATSPDGVTWVDHAIDNIASHADSGDALVFASDSGRFVSTNDDGRRSTSIDGGTWVYGTGATTTLTTDLAFGNGVVVGIGGTSVVLSTDGGVTWSDVGQVAASVEGLVFAQGHFTATASGHVFTSADGRVWTDRPVAGLAPGLLVYGHGTYINVVNSHFRRSSDGVSWAAPVIPSGATNAIQSVTFGPTG